MAERIVQISKPVEITVDDLHDAYQLCKLRKRGIGFQRAMTIPSICLALRCVANAKKRKQLISKPEPAQLALI